MSLKSKLGEKIADAAGKGADAASSIVGDSSKQKKQIYAYV